MTSIFPLLQPSLQTKIAQYALLAHRAAVLAALPGVPASKGRPTYWATQPPPRLLQAVVRYAGQPDTAKVAKVLLRAWFQKKTGLRAAVHRALEAAGYPVPTLTADLEPSPWHARLAPEDVMQQRTLDVFSPKGQPVPEAAEAGLEEVTLMAHLLGWSVLTAVVGEIPPGVPALNTAANGYRQLLELKTEFHRLAEQMPPDLAERVRQGELPDEMAVYWEDGEADWLRVRQALINMRTVYQRSLEEPEMPETAPLTYTELDRLMACMETTGVGEYLTMRRREAALKLLLRVDGLRHRQQPDFAPLAALRERTAATRAAFAAEWHEFPLDKEELAAFGLTKDRIRELLAQAEVYQLLLHLTDHPEQLAYLDETSEAFRALEAAVPSGVLNALLLRKLEVA